VVERHLPMLQACYNFQYQVLSLKWSRSIVMNSTKNVTLSHRSTTEIFIGAVILVILLLGTFLGNLLTSLLF